jgi:hypothetical protein
MKPFIPTVSAQFCANGVMLIAIEKGSLYQYVMSWKEMQKLAKKKGKKSKPEGALKKLTGKVDEMVAASTRSAAESAKLSEALKATRTLPTSPLAPVMPVPPYRRVQAVPVAPPAPIVPPPTASEM